MGGWKIRARAGDTENQRVKERRGGKGKKERKGKLTNKLSLSSLGRRMML